MALQAKNDSLVNKFLQTHIYKILQKYKKINT